jgi:serine/threonine protein kinase
MTHFKKFTDLCPIISLVNQKVHQFMPGSTTLDVSEYEGVQCFGTGPSGSTYQVENKHTHHLAIFKVITTPMSDLEFLAEELTKLTRVVHPTLAPVLAFSLPKTKGRLTILSRHRSDRSLSSWVSAGITFVDATKTQIIVGVAEALRHLHSLGIMHHALTPENVLLSSTMVPVVCDYGLDCCRGNAPANRFSVQYNADDLTNLDVFDFGCLVFGLFTGEFPTGPVLPFIDEEIPVKFRELIRSCWTKPPSRRPTFESILLRLLSGEIALDLTPSEAESLHRYASGIVQGNFATRHLSTVLTSMDEIKQVNSRLATQLDTAQRHVVEAIERALSLGAIDAETAERVKSQIA